MVSRSKQQASSEEDETSVFLAQHPLCLHRKLPCIECRGHAKDLQSRVTGGSHREEPAMMCRQPRGERTEHNRQRTTHTWTARRPSHDGFYCVQSYSYKPDLHIAWPFPLFTLAICTPSSHRNQGAELANSSHLYI